MRVLEEEEQDTFSFLRANFLLLGGETNLPLEQLNWNCNCTLEPNELDFKELHALHINEFDEKLNGAQRVREEI